MTSRAPKTNSPLRRDEEKKRSEIQALTAKFVMDGLSEEEAHEKACAELRDNPSRSWRK